MITSTSKAKVIQFVIDGVPGEPIWVGEIPKGKKLCPVCNKLFEPTSPKQIYCQQIYCQQKDRYTVRDSKR